ncbi:hypothetical protein [Nonomuraea sp. NPDC049684]
MRSGPPPIGAPAPGLVLALVSGRRAVAIVFGTVLLAVAVLPACLRR